MIQFKCVKCQATLRAGDDKAGAAIACPKCKAKLKVPSPRKADPDDDIEEVVPDDDPPPRRKARRDDDEDDWPRRSKSRRRDDDDDDDDDRPRRKRGKSGGPDIASGVVYILLGIAVAAVGIVAPNMMELQINPMVPMIFGPVAGVLIAGLGIFYLVKR